ncbi:unnamed protein product [Ectocarpus fasciculatus]
MTLSVGTQRARRTVTLSKPHVNANIAKRVTLGLMTERSMLDEFAYRDNDVLLQFGVPEKVLRIFTDLLPNARNVCRETTLRDRSRLKSYIHRTSGGVKLATTLALRPVSREARVLTNRRRRRHPLEPRATPPRWPRSAADRLRYIPLPRF